MESGKQVAGKLQAKYFFGGSAMEISLNSKMQQWINEKVDSGLYNNSSEIILEGLRLLRIQEEQRHALTEDLRKELFIGLKQLDSGKSIDFNQAAVRNIKHAGRSRYSP